MFQPGITEIPVAQGGVRGALRLLLDKRRVNNGNRKAKKSRENKYQESGASGQAHYRPFAEIGSHCSR